VLTLLRERKFQVMVEIYMNAYKIRRNHSEKWKGTPSKTAVPLPSKGRRDVGGPERPWKVKDHVGTYRDSGKVFTGKCLGS
jgi:hypothetical protein